MEIFQFGGGHAASKTFLFVTFINGFGRPICSHRDHQFLTRIIKGFERGPGGSWAPSQDFQNVQNSGPEKCKKEYCFSTFQISRDFFIFFGNMGPLTYWTFSDL